MDILQSAPLLSLSIEKHDANSTASCKTAVSKKGKTQNVWFVRSDLCQDTYVISCGIDQKDAATSVPDCKVAVRSKAKA